MTDSGENPSGQDAARPTEPTDQAAPVEPNHETSPPPTSEAPQAPEVEPVADPVDPTAEPASGEPSEAQSDEAKPAAEEVPQQDEPAAQAKSDEADEAKSDEAKPAAQEVPQQNEPAAQAESDDDAQAKSGDAKPAAQEVPQQNEPAAQAESDEADEAKSDEAKPAAEEVPQQDEPAAQAESDDNAQAKSDEAKPAAEEVPQQDEPAAQAESDEAAGTQPDTEPAAEPSSGEQAEARTASTSDPKPSATKKKPASRSAGKGVGGQERRAQRKIPPRRSGAGVPWDEPLALVRYGRMSYVGVFRHNLDPPPKRDTQVVIRTDRGVELGLVLSAVLDDTPKSDPPTDDPATPAPEAPDTEAATPQADCGGCGGGDSPASGMVGCDRLKALGAEGAFEYGFTRLNKILRLASPQDMNDQVHLDRADREKMTYCGQGAAEMGLKMKLVAVEHLLGGERVIFYFTSEARVDFRDLVRRLAGQYRTRIEMRQIGARDEARLVGDYERCGQRCCCQVFLGTLQPVSIRMAKVQKATLDPSKISGRCNRLMCCLRFEDDTYEYLRKLLPKKNIWVRTEDLVAKVLSSQILTQLIRVIDVHGAVSVIDNEAILERDVAAPDPNVPVRPVRRRVETPTPKRDRRPTRPEPDAAKTGDDAPKTQQAPATGEGQQANGEKRRRRRRRGKGRQEAAGGAQAATKSAGGEATAEGAPKKRRRRRRRKPKGGGDGAGGAPPSS